MEISDVNINKNITEENLITKMNNISDLIKSAESAYISCQIKNKSIVVDYKILFILFRSITVSNKEYTIDKNSIKEKILYEAVNNFKFSVENFSNKNVHIIPKIKEINQNINSTFPTYLQYGDILSIIKDIAPTGLYDAIIAVSGVDCFILGVTPSRMFNNDIFSNYSFYGYSSCRIYLEKDENSMGKGYDKNYPYLVTTNIFIHEWLHQLEGYRDILKCNGQNIIYPFAHTYYENYQQNPNENWMKKDNYKWDKNYFNDKTKYPNIVEPELSSFYREVLSCDIEYIPDNNHKIGIYPEFWNLTPNKIVLGRYIIQDLNNSLYLYSRYSSNITYISGTLSHEIGFYWDIYYDILANDNNNSNKLRRKSCIKRDYNTELDLNNSKYIKIGIFEEGEYFIINKTLNKVLAFSVNNNEILIPKVEDYQKSEFQIFKISHYNNCFYKISPVHIITRYLDLDNNWDIEKNTVKFQYWTGYISAQTWQFQYINDNTCDIVPLASTTRSLSYHDNNLYIVSINNNSNNQKWKLENVNNDKFIFDGKYIIKDSLTNKYLYGEGHNLKIDSLYTVWTIVKLDDNYYTISYNFEGNIKYIEALKDNENEQYNIEINNKNENNYGQRWKFILNSDGTVILKAKLAINKGLKCNDLSSLILSKDFGKFSIIRISDV